MNIKREPLDKEGAEADEYFPTLRRSTRVRKHITDFSFIKPRRKKKTLSVCADGIKETEQLSADVKVKVEKSPLDLPLEREHDGGSPFLITLEAPNGTGLDELDEMARSSESTVTAHSDAGSVVSAESFATVSEEDPILLEHSYCTNPRRTVRTHIKKEKKTMEAAAVPAKPTVDLSTLAIYRALMDHNYSTITPSALIEAVMLKHDYVCSFQALQEFSADMEPYEPVSTYLSHQRIKTEPGTDFQASQHYNVGDESGNMVLNPKRGRKRKSPEDVLVKNPKYTSPTNPAKTTKSVAKDDLPPVNSPSLLSNDSELPTKSLKKLIKAENTPMKEPSKKKIRSSEGAKTASALKKDIEKERKSLASKIKVELKLNRRKRRKNTTGWPTKRPQAVDKKPKKLSKPKKDVTKVKNEKSSRDSSSTRSAGKDSKGDSIPSLRGIVLSIEETVKRRRQRVAKSKPVKKPLAGDEGTKKEARSVSPKKSTSQTAVKSPTKGKRKNEGQDELTEDENETQAAADARAENAASTEEQLGSGNESQLSGRPQTTASKGQKSPTKSPRRSQKSIKPQPEPEMSGKAPDAAEAAPEPKKSLRKRVKRGFTSLFKSNCTSKNASPQPAARTKNEEGTEVETTKKKSPGKFDGAGSRTDSVTEGGKSKEITVPRALKKGQNKLIRNKTSKTANKSQESLNGKKNGKLEKQKTKRLRNRNAPLSPPPRRGEPHGKINSTEGLHTFTTVIIKEEPMEREIADDSQPSDWDHFQNVPDKTENLQANTSGNPKDLEDRPQTKFCVSRKNTSESKLEAFAPVETHSGGHSDDPDCYEELENMTNEKSNSLPHAYSCKDGQTYAFSGTWKSYSQATKNSDIAAEENGSNPKNQKSPDEPPIALNLDATTKPAADFDPEESVDSNSSLSAVTEMIKSVNRPFDFESSGKKEGASRSKAEPESKISAGVLGEHLACEKVSCESTNTTESKMESIENVPAKHIQVEKSLERKTSRNTDEMKPMNSENSVPKNEDISTHSIPDVDSLLRKRRDERRLARERRLKKRFALKKQEQHQSTFYNQRQSSANNQSIVNKPKRHKITYEGDSHDEALICTDQVESKTKDQENTTPESSGNVDDGPNDNIAEKCSPKRDRLDGKENQNSDPDYTYDKKSGSKKIHNGPVRDIGDMECQPITIVPVKCFETSAEILRQMKMSTTAEIIDKCKLDESSEKEGMHETICCKSHQESLEDCSQEVPLKASEKSPGNTARGGEGLAQNVSDSGEEYLKQKCKNSAREPAALQSSSDSEDDSQGLSGSDWNDGPFETSSENSDVEPTSRDSSSSRVITVQDDDTPEAKPVKKVATRFQKEFWIPPRIIRRKTVSMDLNTIRTVQAVHAVDLTYHEKACNKDSITLNDQSKLYEQPESQESEGISSEAGKDQPALRKIAEDSGEKRKSPLLPDISCDRGNQALSTQDPEEPQWNAIAKGSGQKATRRDSSTEKCVDCESQEHSASELMNVSEICDDIDSTPALNDNAGGKEVSDDSNKNSEDQEPLFSMLVDEARKEIQESTSTCQERATSTNYMHPAGQVDTESNVSVANIDNANEDDTRAGSPIVVIGTPEVDRVASSTVNGSANASLPVESTNLICGPGQLPNGAISVSDEILSVSPIFNNPPKEKSGYDSDFSIFDPYATDSDEPSPAVQPKPHKQSVLGVGPERSSSKFHPSSVAGVAREANPLDSSANTKGAEGIIIEDCREVWPKKKDPLYDVLGRAVVFPKRIVKDFDLPATGTSRTPAVVPQPALPWVTQPIMPNPPKLDHAYCLNPLKQKCKPEKRDRNERRRVQRRSRREQRKKILAGEQRAESPVDTKLAPIVLRYNSQNMITRIEGLSSDVDPLRENSPQTYGTAMVRGGTAVKEAANRRGSDSSLLDSDEDYQPWMSEKHLQQTKRARRRRLHEKRNAKKLLQKSLQETSNLRDPLGSDRDPLEDIPRVTAAPRNSNSEPLLNSVELASRFSEQMDRDPLEDMSLHQYLQLMPSSKNATVPAPQCLDTQPLISDQDRMDLSPTDITGSLQTSHREPNDQAFQKRTLCFKVVGGKMLLQGEVKEANSLAPGSPTLPLPSNALNKDQGKDPQKYRMHFQGADGKRFSVIKVAPSKPGSVRKFGAVQMLPAWRPTLPKPVSSIDDVIGQVVEASRSYGIDPLDSSTKENLQNSTGTPKLPETPPDEVPRTPSPVDPPYDEKNLPIGRDNVDWKKIEYFPPREVARLHYRIRRRLFGETRAKNQRSYYRKEGRPPYSYPELAAMTIENEPLKCVRFFSMVEFAVKHFRYYSQPRICNSKHWKHAFRVGVLESNHFRNDHVGRHSYFSFKSQYRLPTDPAVFENTEEVPTDSGSEECDEPEPGLPEAEPNPLVPICAYSDEEMEAARESLVQHVNEFLALGNNKALSAGDIVTREDVERVFPSEMVNPIVSEMTPAPVAEDPIASATPPAPVAEDPVYDCSYCSTTYSNCQDAVDHAMSHPEVTKKCPLCNFTSPDGIQLLWHVNANH